jgi:hypothetical protein
MEEPARRASVVGLSEMRVVRWLDDSPAGPAAPIAAPQIAYVVPSLPNPARSPRGRSVQFAKSISPVGPSVSQFFDRIALHMSPCHKRIEAGPRDGKPHRRWKRSRCRGNRGRPGLEAGRCASISCAVRLPALFTNAPSTEIARPDGPTQAQSAAPRAQKARFRWPPKGADTC